jgi:hypothetical protein
MRRTTLMLSRNHDGTYTVTIDGKTYTTQTFDEAREIIESEDNQ